jgi:hypothetical protein
MPAARLSVVVTRRLPDVVETRMKELFNVELRDPDTRMTREELAAAMRRADVLVPNAQVGSFTKAVNIDGATSTTVQVFANNDPTLSTPLSATLNYAGGQISGDLSSLVSDGQVGDVMIRIQAQDAAGNMASRLFSVNIDRTIPTLSLSTVASDNTINASEQGTTITGTTIRIIAAVGIAMPVLNSWRSARPTDIGNP